jgi:integrase
MRDGAGASLINHELGALAQVLDLAGLWHPINQYYERIPEKSWSPPKVMTQEEEARFIRLGSRNQGWKTALNSAVTTGNTTIHGCELRNLRLENLRLTQLPPMILVPTTVKNRNRVRSVPLNDTAFAAVQELLALARERGSCKPQHYLIPFRLKKGLYDPTRPASSCFIRRAFRSIAKASDLPWVTPSTFRHQAITKLLENGAPDETVRAIAGHGTEKAMKYYSHIRIEAKKQAVDRLQSPAPPPKTSEPQTKGQFPLLNDLKVIADQLGIAHEAAVELVLQYEKSKTGSAPTLLK